MGAIRSGLGCLSWVGAALIVIALALKVFLFDMAEVGHNGMAPTLLRGERVLIRKKAAPTLGSIAVCQHPTEVGWVVARVAATEGMTIHSFGTELFIDGKPVEYNGGGSGSFYNEDTDRTVQVTWGDEYLGTGNHQIFLGENRRHHVDKAEVPAGRLYLLGDYRGYMGQDSRAYGVVDASSCRGTIVFRLTPVAGLEPEISHGYFERIR
ncbi:MAG: signal peptidase I [Deltaproteobacteria bacterium]|nr:signal peptidase I [Deltaproteobacteria bacterium]NND28677.1 signal peptidase I [Myxococcales bacterium]MBT8466485.1 signal peptidase I [Deltaproteobacteria bacterium]MBT8481859.1 signal peptidase I [Deltaproteobacteria bacterium]NNK09543.1 signal peptidase I [Myxococcales bacterium]